MAEAGYQRIPGARGLLEGLGDPEVNYLGHRPIPYQNVCGLEIPVQHALLMRMVHRPANLPEQLQTRRQGQGGGGAVFCDRKPIHQFHHEERPALRADP